LQSCSRHNLSVPLLSKDLIDQLTAKKWEGNIRELKNEAEKYVLGMGLGISELTRSGKKESINSIPETTLSLTEQMGEYEKNIIEKELRRQAGSIKESHAALGIPRQTLVDKMKKYGLNKSEFRS
jgi:two-component system C4-dicarboxylate transport response regulator DctD